MTIDLYAWPTPNAYKISIFLEEAGVPYRVLPVDIGRGDQFAPDFLAISPNNRMPAIVDPEGPGATPISVFESGAILVYLAEKVGQFLPADARSRVRVLEWLFWQMAGVGPMIGQAGHFVRYAPEKIPYAIERYTNEAKRLTQVLDRQLGGHDFVAGDYSIADMAIYPWMHLAAKAYVTLGEYPNVDRWLRALAARPGVARGMAIMQEQRIRRPLTDEERAMLFGKAQLERR